MYSYFVFCVNQGTVSLKRIEKFLLQEDIDPDNVQSNPDIGKVIRFFHCWDSSKWINITS